MSLGKRIRNARNARKLSQAAVAKELHVTPQAVSQWELDADIPSVGHLSALAKFFGILMDDLKHNHQPSLRVINSFDPDDEETEIGSAKIVSSIGGAGRRGISPGAVPEFDLRAGASYGGGYAMAATTRDKHGRSFSAEMIRAEWTFPENWLRGEMRLSLETTDILTVDGPSMSPDLEPGDRVLIDRSNRDPKQDAIFAVRDGESIIIKHVQLIRGSEPAKIVCRSSNPKYEPFELILDGEQADIIGRVAGRISRL